MIVVLNDLNGKRIVKKRNMGKVRVEMLVNIFVVCFKNIFNY